MSWGRTFMLSKKNVDISCQKKRTINFNLEKNIELKSLDYWFSR